MKILDLDFLANVREDDHNFKVVWETDRWLVFRSETAYGDELINLELQDREPNSRAGLFIVNLEDQSFGVFNLGHADDEMFFNYFDNYESMWDLLESEPKLLKILARMVLRVDGGEFLPHGLHYESAYSKICFSAKLPSLAKLLEDRGSSQIIVDILNNSFFFHFYANSSLETLEALLDTDNQKLWSRFETLVQVISDRDPDFDTNEAYEEAELILNHAEREGLEFGYMNLAMQSFQEGLKQHGWIQDQENREIWEIFWPPMAVMDLYKRYVDGDGRSLSLDIKIPDPADSDEFDTEAFNNFLDQGDLYDLIKSLQVRNHVSDEDLR